MDGKGLGAQLAMLILILLDPHSCTCVGYKVEFQARIHCNNPARYISVAMALNSSVVWAFKVFFPRTFWETLLGKVSKGAASQCN